MGAICQRSTNQAHLAGRASGIMGSPDRITRQQKQHPDQVEPNISLLPIELQRQLHGSLSRHLGNIVIKPGSSCTRWWTCDNV
ncbi:hypothetical protein WJX77_000971 [Trebouxia sp. C0004]